PLSLHDALPIFLGAVLLAESGSPRRHGRLRAPPARTVLLLRCARPRDVSMVPPPAGSRSPPPRAPLLGLRAARLARLRFRVSLGVADEARGVHRAASAGRRAPDRRGSRNGARVHSAGEVG